MIRIAKILFLLLLFYSTNLICAETTINGDASNFKGEIIKLKIYSNPISKNLVEISRDTINDDGSFTLKSDINSITYANIVINNIYFTLYLEPKTSYKIKIPTKAEILDGDPEIRLKAFLPIEMFANITNQDTNSLNYSLGAFNEIYNNFMIANEKNLINQRNKKLVNSFKESLNKRFSNIKNEYLTRYIEYRIASLEMMEQLHNREDFKNIYFNNRPILYNNDEYLAFFDNFFNKHLLKLSKTKLRDTIIYAINNEKSYTSLIKIMALDSTLLLNDTLREYVMINGLYDLYKYKEFKKEGIKTILAYIAKNGNVETHKNIAGSILNELTKLESGSIAPDFKAICTDGNIKSLTDFKGKMVYINFFTSWNMYSIEEIKATDSIQKKFGDKVEVFNISTDDNIDDLKNAIENYKIKSKVYNYSIYKDLIDLYEIKSIPFSILIDESGKIISYPALKPSENMLGYLDKLFKERAFENQKQNDELKKIQLKNKVKEINNEK